MISRTEVEVRMGKLKSGKVAGNGMVDWICRLCNTAFKRGAMPEGLLSAVGKGEGTECSNYKGISLLMGCSPG